MSEAVMPCYTAISYVGPCCTDAVAVSLVENMALNATYPQILTEGGDDRLILNKKGTNKYHCTPKPIVGSLFRGSCTCNIPTETAYQAAEAAFYSLRSGEISVGDIMEGVRSRIKSLYDLPAGTEVFLCPSGSDAEYMPLLIAKTLNKGRKVDLAPMTRIVNIVTCDSEVGSGTIDAAGGRYFSNVVPLPDWKEEDKDDIKLMGSPVYRVPGSLRILMPLSQLEGLANGVECISIPARCRDNGDVVDSSDPIQVKPLSSGAFVVLKDLCRRSWTDALRKMQFQSFTACWAPRRASTSHSPPPTSVRTHQMSFGE
eukprot:757738-Hanusia_phi.AAC.1